MQWSIVFLQAVIFSFVRFTGFWDKMDKAALEFHGAFLSFPDVFQYDKDN